MELNREWLNDPALAGIDKKKLGFLEQLFVKSRSVNMGNQKEMMSFLMSLSKFSRDNNISFNKNEFELIYSVLQKYSSAEDIEKMQQISSRFKF